MTPDGNVSVFRGKDGSKVADIAWQGYAELTGYGAVFNGGGSFSGLLPRKVAVARINR